MLLQLLSCETLYCSDCARNQTGQLKINLCDCMRDFVATIRLTTISIALEQILDLISTNWLKRYIACKLFFIWSFFSNPNSNTISSQNFNQRPYYACTKFVLWFESKIAPVINGNPQQKHLVLQKKWVLSEKNQFVARTEWADKWTKRDKKVLHYQSRLISCNPHF